MSESIEYKTLLTCFDKLVVALRSDPHTISNQLAAAGLIPPPDGQIEAQQLAERMMDIVKVVPARYGDVLTILSKHDWLKDIVEIVQTSYGRHQQEQCITKDTSMSSEKATDDSDHEARTSMPSKEATDKIKYDYPHKSPSLPISNPVLLFDDLSDDDREDLSDQINELTKKINLKFKKFLNQVYKSLRNRHVEHNSVILTLTEDEVMIFDQDDKLDEAKDMFEVFKVIRPHCSYFNYDLLQLLVEVHGSSEDKASLGEYIQCFSSYCEAMPCAEEICGNGDSQSKRIKLKFKINFDRKRLKPDALRRIKCNIAHHLNIKPSSLYLRTVKEGCVSLEFLVSFFLFEHIFPLSDAQKAALYNEERVISIHCDSPSLQVDVEKDVLLFSEEESGESRMKVSITEAIEAESHPTPRKPEEQQLQVESPHMKDDSNSSLIKQLNNAMQRIKELETLNKEVEDQKKQLQEQMKIIETENKKYHTESESILNDYFQAVVELRRTKDEKENFQQMLSKCSQDLAQQRERSRLLEGLYQQLAEKNEDLIARLIPIRKAMEDIPMDLYTHHPERSVPLERLGVTHRSTQGRMPTHAKPDDHAGARGDVYTSVSPHTPGQFMSHWLQEDKNSSMADPVQIVSSTSHHSEAAGQTGTLICPLCGKFDFKTQTDLELHCALCD